MGKIKVSTVRYANSYPMNWGLLNGPVKSLIDIDFDHPSGVAEKLTSGKADIGLVPVAALPALSNPVIVGNYCIGTKGKVRTVMLMSNSPLNMVKTIWLDHRSVTSVNLVRVLARDYWNQEFIWERPGPLFDYSAVKPDEAIVIIGDQCFDMENRFAYTIDLAEAWNSLTGLPFVFACWVAVNNPDNMFITIFDESLRQGISETSKAINAMNTLSSVSNEQMAVYLRDNIDYMFDATKRNAMELFLEKINTLKKL
jgi:chorismate dehydratase